MSITITPINGDIGATITGITGTEAATPEVASQVQAAIERYGVVVFPHLHISDDDMAALARLLGEVVLPPHGALADHPEIAPITRDPEQDKMAQYREATFNWHTDGTMSDVPDKLTMLTAIRTAEGAEGNTEFATTYAAYERASRRGQGADRRSARPALVRQCAAEDRARPDGEAARAVGEGAVA